MVQYPMNAVPNTYAPVQPQQQAAHNSMYGFYAPQAENSGFPPMKAELPHSPSPPAQSAVTPVSSDATPERHTAA